MIKTYNNVNEMMMDNKGFTTFAGYVKDLNIKVNFMREAVKIMDITNSLKTGKTCRELTIYKNLYHTNTDIYCDLFNNGIIKSENIETFITEAMEGKLDERLISLDYDVRVDEHKGVKILSPFAEVKPIKMPKKFNRSNVVKAIMSGQIFKGVINGCYTDDYAYDASVNFHKGADADLFELAEEIIDYSTTNIYAEEEKDGIVKISVSLFSSQYYTLYFDVNCNKEEAIKRNSTEQEEKENTNNEMLSNTIEIKLEDIEDDIYEIEYLEMNDNTELYEIKKETVTSANIIIGNHISYKYNHIVGLKPFDIIDNELYIIGATSELETLIKEDSRVVADISLAFVTGKALKEFAQEELGIKVLGTITINEAIKNINKYQAGYIKELFSDSTDFLKEIDLLSRLENELKRANNNPEPPKPTKSTELNTNTTINNVVAVDFSRATASVPVNKSNKAWEQDQATPKQLYALFCLTKIKTTGLKMSKGLASKLISKAKAGEDIKSELNQLINSNSQAL